MTEYCDRIYIRGFPSSYTSDSLRERFREYGPIKSIYITNNEGTAPFGIIRYKNPNNAPKAVEAANAKQEGDITWYVAICEKKNERKAKRVNAHNQNIEIWKKTNLFVKGLPSDVTNEKLQAHFGIYGDITSISIKNDKVFVCFDKEEDAKKAIEDAKTRLFEEKKLNVTSWIPERELKLKMMINQRKRQMYKVRQERKKKKSEERGQTATEEAKEAEPAMEKQDIIAKEAELAKEEQEKTATEEAKEAGPAKEEQESIAKEAEPAKEE
ncbi:unnamed protein product [Blepharisma stoltei]|uniref:RRM domain-containing protein n=1 Tax=Blepharisma stoltei TaxID=1481888 RepID=A0AAU9JSP5_9CILI|nr:unnamed protein product [Blepharisma stoltei]